MTTIPLVSFNDDRTLPCRAADVDPNVFYPDHGNKRTADADAREAKRICAGCPRRVECADHAIEAKETLGIWGGLTPSERVALARRRIHGVEENPAERPTPPPRQQVRWGWYRTGMAEDPAASVGNMLAAGRAFLDGTMPRSKSARVHGIRIGKLAEAVAILRYATDVVVDVEAGWVQWYPAYVYAQQVKRWEGGHGSAAGVSEEAA